MLLFVNFTLKTTHSNGDSRKTVKDFGNPQIKKSFRFYFYHLNNISGKLAQNIVMGQFGLIHPVYHS